MSENDEEQSADVTESEADADVEDIDADVEDVDADVEDIDADVEDVDADAEAEDVDADSTGNATEDTEDDAGGDTEDDAGGDTEDDAGGDTEGGAGEDAEGPSEEIEADDFVRLSYTMRTKESGRLVDTTQKGVAEEEGIDTEERDFGPRTFVIGGGQLFAAVEDDVTGKSVGDAGTVTIPATEAFGEYDPEEVRTISADRLPEDDRQPGAQVNVDGQQGFVATVIGGRARVDFNHPLAGDDIEYNYEIVGVVEDRLERAEELLATYLDMQLNVSIGVEEEEETVYDEEEEDTGTTETVEHETLYIEATPQLTMNQQWMFSKQQIAEDLRERIGVDRIVVREVLDGGGMMGGMMGGMGGDVDEEDLESAIEEADLDEEVDADEIVEELEAGTDEE
jgi:FKBP-type peptidyl-prolyl cis-trans isomerase SlyD